MAKQLFCGSWWLGVSLFFCAVQSASAQSASRVYLWNVATGKQTTALSPFAAKYGRVTSVAFSPDGARLAAGSSLNGFEAGYLKIWDAKKGKLISESKLDFPVNAVKFFPDGKTLVVGSHKGTFLVSAKTGKPVAKLGGGHAFFVDVSRDGSIVAANAKGRVTAWNVATRKPIFELKPRGPLPFAYGVSISPDKKYVAFGDRNGGVGMVDIAKGKVVHTFATPKMVQSVAFSPNGKQLAGGNRSTGNVYVWNVATRKQTVNLTLGKEGIFSLAWSPKGDVLAASVFHARKITFLKTRTRKLLREIDLPDFQGARSVTFSPNGKILAAACTPTVANSE